MLDARRSSSETSGSCEPENSNDIYSQKGSSTSSFSTIIDFECHPSEDSGNSFVIPATLEKLPDPRRWKRLESTPSKSPLKGRFMVPDPSPAASDADSMFTAKESPSSCLPPRRRGEHVARPPVWKLFEPDLAQKRELARAWPLLSTAGNENTPLEDSSPKRLAISGLRKGCSGLEWLATGYFSDDPRIAVPYQAPLIVNTMTDQDTAQPSQEPSGELLQAKTYASDGARQYRTSEGSSEAQGDITDTPSDRRTGASTDQQDTRELQTPLTRPSDTPDDGAEMRDSDPARNRRGTLDDELPQLSQNLTKWEQNEEYHRQQSDAHNDSRAEPQPCDDTIEAQSYDEQTQQEDEQSVFDNESANLLDRKNDGHHPEYPTNTPQNTNRSGSSEKTHGILKDSCAYAGSGVQEELRESSHGPVSDEQEHNDIDTSSSPLLGRQSTVTSEELQERVQEAENNMFRNLSAEPPLRSARKQEAEGNMFQTLPAEPPLRSAREKEAEDNLGYGTQPPNAITPDQGFLQRAWTAWKDRQQRRKYQKHMQSDLANPDKANSDGTAHSLPSRSLGRVARDKLFRNVGVQPGSTEPSRRNSKSRPAVRSIPFGPKDKKETIRIDSAGAPAHMTSEYRQSQRDQIKERSGQQELRPMPNRLPGPADDRSNSPIATAAATRTFENKTITYDKHGIPIGKTPLREDPLKSAHSRTASDSIQQTLSRPANTNEDLSDVEEEIPLTRTASHRPSNPFAGSQRPSNLSSTSIATESKTPGYRVRSSSSSPDLPHRPVNKHRLVGDQGSSSVADGKGKQAMRPQSYHEILKSISEGGKWGREEAERAAKCADAAKEGTHGQPPITNEDRGHPPIPQAQAPSERSMLNITQTPVDNGSETVGVHKTSSKEERAIEGEENDDDKGGEKKKSKKSRYSWMWTKKRGDRKDDDKDKKGRKKDGGNGGSGSGAGGSWGSTYQRHAKAIGNQGFYESDRDMTGHKGL